MSSLSWNQTPLGLVAAFLTEQGWPCEETVDAGLLRSRVQSSRGEWVCLVHYRPQGDQLLFYSVAPLAAPEVLRPAVAEYITRANWDLILGNFEMDYADGEVRFKTSIQLNGTALTPELLQPLLFGNVAVMDKYLPGLQAVIALTHTPSSAINAIEGAESLR